jgi:hypothetical protein
LRDICVTAAWFLSTCGLQNYNSPGTASSTSNIGSLEPF